MSVNVIERLLALTFLLRLSRNEALGEEQVATTQRVRLDVRGHFTYQSCTQRDHPSIPRLGAGDYEESLSVVVLMPKVVDSSFDVDISRGKVNVVCAQFGGFTKAASGHHQKLGKQLRCCIRKMLLDVLELRRLENIEYLASTFFDSNLVRGVVLKQVGLNQLPEG
jgi:hypothetical protein